MSNWWWWVEIVCEWQMKRLYNWKVLSLDEVIECNSLHYEQMDSQWIRAKQWANVTPPPPRLHYNKGTHAAEEYSSLSGDTHRVCDSWSEAPGFESCVGWLMWCGHIPVVPMGGPNWFNKGLVMCITVYGCVHLKYPFESVEKSRGLSPGSGFLSVADMSITVTKGDVKLQQTNKQAAEE